MKELKDIVTNLVTEAVQSVKLEGRTPTATTLSLKAGTGVGTNVDQLWLRCIREYKKVLANLTNVEDKIYAYFDELEKTSTSQEQYEQAKQNFMLDKENPLMREYLYLSGIEDIWSEALENYKKDHEEHGGIASTQARNELKSKFFNELTRFDTDSSKSAATSFVKSPEKIATTFDMLDLADIEPDPEKFKSNTGMDLEQAKSIANEYMKQKLKTDKNYYK